MVHNTRGQILVQDRLDPNWGGVCFPGGHIEPGESAVAAAIREVREETGLTIENPTLCGLKQFPIAGGRYLVLLFKTDCYSGTLQDSAEGPVFWVCPADLPQYRLSENFLDLLRVFQDENLSEMYWSRENGDWKLSLL